MRLIDLEGRTIVSAEAVSAGEMGFEGDQPCIFLLLDNDVSLGVLMDPEGNGPGVLTWTDQVGGSGLLVE